jgi:hypothetical protein
MNNSPTRVDRAELKKAEKLGRGGDDRLVHVNSFEEAVLRGLGGSGEINPRTGLREYAAGGAANRSDGGLGPTGDGPGTGGGRGANGGNGQGGRGGGSFGGFGGGSFSHRDRTTSAGRAAGAAGPTARDRAAGGGTGQSGRGGQTFQGETPRYSDARDDPAAKENTARNQDAQNIGESWGDGLPGIGNEIAHLFGGFLGLGEREEDFTETAMDMSRPNYNGPAGGPGTGGTNSANWGFDPVGALVGIGGMLGGLPAGPGLIADWASQQLGRPLDVNLGRTVFGIEDDPATGQTASSTHTGGSMTVHDSREPGTFYGVSPTLNYLGQGAANTVPTRQTFTGADPAPVDQPAEAPYQPVTPQPSPIDTPPAGGSFDAGNTQLTSQQLSDLFVGYMNPSRTARGRSSARVVV